MLVCQAEKREDNWGRRIAPLTYGHARLEVEAAGANEGTRPIAEDSKCILCALGSDVENGTMPFLMGRSAYYSFRWVSRLPVLPKVVERRLQRGESA
jgi:hypothetical protein